MEELVLTLEKKKFILLQEDHWNPLYCSKHVKNSFKQTTK